MLNPMAARNISITPELLAPAEARVDSGAFETVSEYICSLVRADRERSEAMQQLRTLLEDGEDSGPTLSLTPDELCGLLKQRLDGS